MKLVVPTEMLNRKRVFFVSTEKDVQKKMSNQRRLVLELNRQVSNQLD